MENSPALIQFVVRETTASARQARGINPWSKTTGQQLPNRIVPLRGPPLSHAFGAVPVRLDPGATLYQ